MEEKDNSITFRSYGLENDDHCKTIVKVESDYMNKLGIKEGDIVKVTGKCSAMAFCFSLNKEELEKTKSQDLPIEYLNSDHEEIEYPPVIMSSPVHCNACPSRRLSLVTLEKLPTHDIKNQIPDANIITIGTMKFAENIMPGYKNNIDFSPLFGQIVKKQERINTSFLQDFAEKHQQTSRDGYTHTPKFSSIIINVKPENHDFWLVTKNTKFEFQDIPIDEFNGEEAKPKALSFLKTIPIPHKFHVRDTEIVFTSLEIFENDMNLKWYSLQRIKLPEDIFLNPSKADEMAMHMCHESAELTIEIKDDLGNVHADGLSMGGGGHSGPDPTTNEMVLDHLGECQFCSTLNPKAKEISIIVKEIKWIKRNHIGMSTPTTSNMGQMAESLPIFSILEGLWEFKIIL